MEGTHSENHKYICRYSECATDHTTDHRVAEQLISEGLGNISQVQKLPFRCAESEATPPYIYCVQCPCTCTCRSLHMMSFTRSSPMLVLQSTKG